MKRTRQPKKRIRKAVHGFLERQAREKQPASGSHIIKNRRAKGRKRLSV